MKRSIRLNVDVNPPRGGIIALKSFSRGRGGFYEVAPCQFGLHVSWGSTKLSFICILRKAPVDE